MDNMIYEVPAFEVIDFACDDIICSSACPTELGCLVFA